MQPQDPNNPNPSQNPQVPTGQSEPPQPEAPTAPTPAYPSQPTVAQPTPMAHGPAAPMASPLPPQPGQVPGGSPFPHAGAPAGPGQHPLAPANKKKKVMVVAIIAVALLIVVGVAAFFVMKMLGGVKLEKYSNENITVLVPAGYSKTEENGGATFEEKEGAEDTHSEVIAFYEALPSGLSESDLEEFRGTLRTVLQQAAENSASGNDQSVENMKVTDITFNGDKALKLTGDAVEKGKKVASYTMIAGLNSKAVYLVGVGVNQSDPGLGKKVDTIINSFKLNK